MQELISCFYKTIEIKKDYLLLAQKKFPWFHINFLWEDLYFILFVASNSHQKYLIDILYINIHIYVYSICLIFLFININNNILIIIIINNNDILIIIIINNNLLILIMY